MSNNNAIGKLRKEKSKMEEKGQWKEAAAMCNYIGQELCKLGKYEEALQSHKEELHLCSIQNDILGIAVANRRIGECYTELNQFSKALQHLKTFLELATKLESNVELQRAWATLGRTYYFKYLHEIDKNLNEDSRHESLDKAQHAYKKALDLADNLRDEISAKESAEMRSRLLLNLGLVFERRKKLTECADSIRQAIYLTKKFNLFEDLHRCQYSLATIYQTCGQYNYALRLLDETMSSAKTLKDKGLLCEAFAAKANILIMLKDFEGARTYLKKAYRMETPISSDREHVEKLLKHVLFICKCERELLLIKDNLDTRKSLLEKMGDALVSIECYKVAIEYYLSSLECLENMNASSENLSAIYFSLAQTYSDLDEFDKALEYFWKELETNEGKPIEQIKTLWKIAEINSEQGKMIEAEKIYSRALEVSEKVTENKYKYNCLKRLEYFYKNYNDQKYQRVIENLKELNEFKDLGSDESESEDIEEPFIDIDINELSDDTDSDVEKELYDSKRPRRISKRSDHKRNELGETPLHRACITGNLNMVKHLIETGHPVNTRDHCGWLPLHEACNYGFCDIVEYLIEKGAFINDRGGKLCDGITPLHDAASCGNFDVMELLISKGASVAALNNHQETPLDCLGTWWERSKKDLDSEAIKQYKEMHSKLKNLMKQVGINAQSNGADETLSDIIEDLPDSSEQLENSPVRVQEKRQRSPSITSDEDEITYINPHLDLDQEENSFDDPNVARSEYKAVMSSLRRNIKITEPIKSIEIKQKSSALLDENSRVTDWLIQDTYTKPQKSGKKRPKYSKLNIHKKNQSIQRFLVNSGSDNDSVRSISPCLTIDDENASNSSKQFLSNAKPSESTNTSLSTVPVVNLTSNLFRLRICVNDKVILVPVPDDTCTIAWLIEETEKRFQSLVGSRPHLSLLNTDGAILSPPDLIKTVLQNNEEVLSSIISWEHPSLQERFKQICEKNCLDFSETLKHKLSIFDSSYELNLSDVYLSLKHLSMLISALKHYNILTHLNLNNIEISKDLLHCLVNSIPSFKSLLSLNLSCCSLSGTNIKELACSLTIDNVTQTSYLQKLQTLNISYNFLTTENANDLIVFLGLPSIQVLDVASCGISSVFFTNQAFCHALIKAEHLKEFNVMGNDFKSDGISTLLTFLPRANITKIDLSHSLLERVDLGKHLQKYMSLDILPHLEELHLSGCYLNNEDLALLADCIGFCPKLRLINFSSNPDLYANAVVEFVAHAHQFNIPLKVLSVTGIHKWSQDEIDTFINIFCLKFLIGVTIDPMSDVYEKLLFDSWKDCWGNTAHCNNELICELSID